LGRHTGKSRAGEEKTRNIKNKREGDRETTEIKIRWTPELRK